MTVGELVELNFGWLRRNAAAFAGKYGADDLTGETVYRCLRYAERYDASMSFKPWALAIMARTYITQYHRDRRLGYRNEVEEDFFPSVETTETRAMMRCLLSLIRRCRRKSIAVDSVLLYAMGYSYDEIARAFGIPVGTVKSRISNGRLILAAAFDMDFNKR